MNQGIDLREQLITTMSQMNNPATRQQLISQLPSNVQAIFSDHEARFKVIGQDGTQALIDLQNQILHGIQAPESSIQILKNIRDKLLG